MVVLTKIIPLALAGLAVFFLGNAIFRPAQARLTGQALTETGTGLGASLGSVGQGVQTFLTGVGTGSAQLFNPLFTLRDLIGGSADQNQVREIVNASNTTFDIPTPNTAASSPGVTPETEAQQQQRIITFGSGARTTLPLSQAAVDYYRGIGVEVQ